MKMLTDDPFLLTGILIIAMIPLYILILKKLRPNQPLTRTATASNSNKHNFKTKKENNISERKTTKNTQPEKPEYVCYHDFGYLRTIPKKASIPNECLGCPKIVECLTRGRAPAKNTI
jgi:hypothetical protein